MTKFVFSLVFVLSGSFCFAQRDTGDVFKKKILEMRKQRLEIEKKNPTQAINRTTFYADGGLVSFTPKGPNSGVTNIVSVSAGTIPPRIYNYEYATDMCSMSGPSNQITSDSYYEWDVSYNNGVTWQLGAAGQGSSLQLGIVTQSAIYRRYCYPWDLQGSITNGCGAYYSNIITINVTPAQVNPVTGGSITTTSQLTNICPGSSVSFLNQTSANSTNSGTITYQWQEKVSGSSSFVDISNATNDSYNAPNITQNTTFRRKATDALNSFAYSNELSISVNSNTTSSLQITNGNSVTVACIGGVTLTTTATNIATYQWQKLNNGVYENINGANLSSYNIPEPGSYRVIGTAPCLANQIISNTCVVNITNYGLTPSITISTNSPLVGSCENVGFLTSTGVAVNTSRQWQKLVNGVFVNIANATQTYYVVEESGEYRVSTTRTCDNTTIFSNTIAITIIPSGNPSEFGNGIWRFYGFDGTSADISQNTYKGFYDNDVPTNPNNFYTQDHWNTFFTPSTLSQNTLYTTDWYGCNLNNPSSLTVIAKRRGFDCGSYNLWVRVSSGDRLKLVVDGTIINETYTAAPGFSNEYLSAPITLNANSTIEVWTSSSTAGTFINFEARRISGTNLLGGTISPSTQTLTTGATPALLNNATNPTGGNGSTYLYQWEQSNQFIGPFTEIANATNNTLQLGALYQTTYVRRKTHQASCSYGAYSNVATLTLPQSTPITGGAITLNGAATAICQGTTPSLISSASSAANGTGNYTYTWQKNVNNTNWEDIANSNTLNYQPQAITTATEFRRKVTDASNAVAYSNVVAFSIASNTINAGSISISPLICSATTSPVYISGTPASGGKSPYYYVWEKVENSSNTAVTPSSQNEDLTGLFSAANYKGLYTRKVTDACGSSSTTPLVQVDIQEISGGVVSPTLQTINAGARPQNIINITNALHTGNFNPDASSVPVTVGYQWQSANNANGPWTDIQGATAKTYQSGPLNQTTYFKRVAKENFCNKTNEDVIATVNVNAIPSNISTLFGGGITTLSRCVSSGNQPTLITENAASSDGIQPYVFAWEKWTATTGTWSTIAGANGTIFQPAALTETTKFRRKTNDQSNQTAYSNEVTIVVNASITGGTITPANQNVAANVALLLPFSLSNNFTGGTGNFTYQWQESTNSNGPWTDILGATNTNYLPPVYTTPTTVYYRLKAIDAGCNSEGFSQPVSLTVTPTQSISNLFGGGITTTATCVTLPSTPAPIFVSAASSDGVQPYTYEWQMQPVGSGSWSVIPGATSPELATPPAITTDTKFRRKTIDRMGNIAFSNEISYTVVAAILDGGSIALNTVSTCAANSINVGLINNTVAASGGTMLNYQWQFNNGNGWTDITNASNANYTHGVITVTTQFRRKVTDACGRSAFSNTITVNISSTPIVSTKGGLVNGPFITCSNTALSNSIQNVISACGNGNLAYQWEQWNGNSWLTVAGETSENYNPGSISITTTYRRKVTDACGNIAYSNEVTIHVYPPIESGTITPASQELCSNITPAVIQLATNCHYTNGTVTYQWQVASNSNGPWTNVPGATTSSYQPPIQNNNAYYRLEVSSTTCNTVVYTNVAAIIRLSGCRTAMPSNNLSKQVVSSEATILKPVLFPNPLSYQNTFTIQMPEAGNYTVTLTHLSGEREPVQTHVKNLKTISVTLQRKLPKGTYIVSVSSSKNKWTEKLLIQ